MVLKLVTMQTRDSTLGGEALKFYCEAGGSLIFDGALFPQAALPRSLPLNDYPFRHFPSPDPSQTQPYTFFITKHQFINNLTSTDHSPRRYFHFVCRVFSFLVTFTISPLLYQCFQIQTRRFARCDTMGLP